jgi:hypothetical protein
MFELSYIPQPETEVHLTEPFRLCSAFQSYGPQNFQHSLKMCKSRRDHQILSGGGEMEFQNKT